MDHPVTLRALDVLRIVDITPTLRRVVLGGAELGPIVRDGVSCPAFRTDAPDDHVKIFPPTDAPLVLPTQHEGHLDWPDDPPAVARDYTVRSFDAVAGELVLDVVLGHDGPGAAWAEQVCVGERIHIAGPRHSVDHPMDASSYVLVGDEAALPALARFCDELPGDVALTVIAVAAEPDRGYPIAARDVVWVDPDDSITVALGEAVRRAVAAHDDPYVFAALEYADARRIRATLRDAGVDRARHHVTHYWRRQTDLPAQERVAAEAIVRPMLDLVGPTVLRVAASIGLPDALAAGADTRAAVAGRTGTDPDAVGVLLDYLVSRGLVHAVPDDRFELTTAGELLRSDDPSGFHGFLDRRTASGHFATALPGLQHAVETGTSAYEHVHGLPFWDALEQDPALGAAFDRQLASWAQEWAPAVAALDVWRGRVLDVGGGNGVLATALVDAHDDVDVHVLELPAAAERARSAIAGRQMDGRVAVVDGDFFAPLPRADVVVLAQVLHDWPDEQATQILHRCAEAMAPNGRLIVVERLAAAVDRGDHAAMSVLMLSLFGAKERDRHHYDLLLARSGLEIVATHPTGTALTVLEARRADRPH